MTKLRIEADLDNDSFTCPDCDQVDPLAVTRLLRRVSTKIEAGNAMGPLIDDNGNTVGSFTLTEE